MFNEVGYFRYVNIKTNGCEGWLNVFFGEHCIALVSNVWLADKVREKIDNAKDAAVETDTGGRCPLYMDYKKSCVAWQDREKELNRKA